MYHIRGIIEGILETEFWGIVGRGLCFLLIVLRRFKSPLIENQKYLICKLYIIYKIEIQ